jgi:hypothetical protein
LSRAPRGAPSARRLIIASAAITGAAAVLPATAHAHGFVGRADLPIPDWLFVWAAAIVLVVSFVALGTLWRTPRYATPSFRRTSRVDRLVSARATEVTLGVVGTGLLALVLYAGFAGTEAPTDNLAPNLVFVLFWVGLVPVQLLLGDVFRALNPWRAVGRAAGWASRRAGIAVRHRPYPERLGYWPAALGIFAFAWLELVEPEGESPVKVATATVIYSLFTWAAMAVYGTERWSQRGEAFGVYFGLFARMSPWARHNGRLGLQPPLAGLASWPAGPGAVALLAVMIGTVSFDGLSAGKPFNQAISGVLDTLRGDAGLGAPQALQAVFAMTMVLVVAFAAGLYWVGVAGAGLDGEKSLGHLARTFAHSLVPIAFAYVAAHYVSLLVFQGQAAAYLISDPLGTGADLFGTAGASIDYAVMGAETLWYLQVGFVVLGHVAAVVLAHDKALVAFRTPRAAVRSQYPMLVVMIGFTTLALWLLAQAREG